jgi:hypothetical protein
MQSSPENPNPLVGLTSEREIAALFNESPRTWARRRQLREGPPYIQLGRRIYYRLDAVRQWLLAHERNEQRKPAALRARG